MARPEGESVGREFFGMTFPRYRPVLSQLGCAEEFVAFGLYRNGSGGKTAIGLILGSVSGSEPQTGELLSVYVDPKHRFQGLAKKLLTEFETHMRGVGGGDVRAVYTTGTSTWRFLESLLTTQGWSRPIVRMYLFEASIERLMQAEWMRWFEHLPAGYSIVGWDALAPGQRRKLSERISNSTDTVSQDVIPFLHEAEGMDKAPPVRELNLACLFQGEVVGWHFAHLINDSTVRFSCSYVLPEARTHVPMLALWARSFAKMGSHWRRVKWGVYPRHTAMVEFNQRFMFPYVDAETVSKSIQKKL